MFVCSFVSVVPDWIIEFVPLTVLLQVLNLSMLITGGISVVVLSGRLGGLVSWSLF